MSIEKKTAWTIYWRPMDFPEMAVARQFALDGPAAVLVGDEWQLPATGNVIIGGTVSWVRGVLLERNPQLICFGRDATDPTSVVETWL